MGVNRPQALSGVWMPRAVGAPPAISGTSGVWTDVTPSGISLAPGYSQTVSGNTDDNYGVQDILCDPRYPSHFYAFVCYQGCWRSTDFGLTWAKVSAAGSALDGGKNWGAAMAPDGSYMLNTCGNNFTGSPEIRQTIQRSTDNGVTWAVSASLSADPYNVAICPYDKTRAIAAMHDTDHFYESLDCGVTWTDMGVVNAAITNSGFAFYLHNADTVLYVGGDSDNTYRGTKSGGTWTWTQVTDLNGAGHVHGASQLFYDTANGAFFHASGAVAGGDGIWKSTNDGVNWTRHYTTPAAVIIGTPSTLYAMASAPQNTGDWDARFTSAPRNPGTSWATATDPTGMVNGAKRFAMSTDGLRYVILAGCWHGGIWRYVE